MKTVFVTGAEGFLGRHLCASLLNADYQVVGLQRDFPRSPDRPMVHFMVHGDVRDRALMERVLVEYQVDAVVHLAAQAQVSVGAANPTETFDVNFNGTLAVLEACRRQGVKRVVVASTDKVYGSVLDAVESSPLIERSPYGASKACADLLAQTYQRSYGMSVAVTRCGNLYGPGHLNWSTLIPGTIKRLLTTEEKAVVRFGGRAVRDFLHVCDAVEAYRLLIESDAEGAFNFSGSEPKMIMAIVDRLLELAGKPGQVEVTSDGIGEIQNQSLNCYRARTELAWVPKVRLEDGLKTTFEWYKEYLGVKCAS